MNLIKAVEGILTDIRLYLDYLEDTAYEKPLDVLSNSSTGQHTRHVIEFFQCLLDQRLTGTVNYDKRVRNEMIQKHTSVATTALQEILDGIQKVDPKEVLKLEVGYDMDRNETQTVDTTFERELVYNVEHAIHHMAMIKIGLREIAPGCELPKGFGVAPSTVKYQEQQAASN